MCYLKAELIGEAQPLKKLSTIVSCACAPASSSIMFHDWILGREPILTKPCVSEELSLSRRLYADMLPEMGRPPTENLSPKTYRLRNGDTYMTTHHLIHRKPTFTYMINLQNTSHVHIPTRFTFLYTACVAGICIIH